MAFSGIVGYGERIGLVVGRYGTGEDLLGILAVFGKDIIAGHQEAGGGVGVAIAEAQLGGLGKHVVKVLERALLVDDQAGVVALAAVGSGGLGKDLAIGAVHHHHGALVADPAQVDFLEAHAFDDTGIVTGKEGFDFHAEGLAHILEERIPKHLEVLAGLGGDDAEIEGLLRLGGQRAAQQHGRDQQAGKKTGKHVFLLG